MVNILGFGVSLEFFPLGGKVNLLSRPKGSYAVAGVTGQMLSNIIQQASDGSDHLTDGLTEYPQNGCRAKPDFVRLQTSLH